jgi:hypothetical protein
MKILKKNCVKIFCYSFSIRIKNSSRLFVHSLQLTSVFLFLFYTIQVWQNSYSAVYFRHHQHNMRWLRMNRKTTTIKFTNKKQNMTLTKFFQNFMVKKKWARHVNSKFRAHLSIQILATISVHVLLSAWENLFECCYTMLPLYSMIHLFLLIFFCLTVRQLNLRSYLFLYC